VRCRKWGGLMLTTRRSEVTIPGGVNMSATLQAAIDATPVALPVLAAKFGVTQNTILLWADGRGHPPSRTLVIREAENLMRWYNHWNPRYLAYCQAGGEPDPDITIARDEERWKGGKMTGFMLWLRERWATWRRIKGMTPDAVLFEADHQEFDQWLWANLGAVEK
jgi:hypothetical protein